MGLYDEFKSSTTKSGSLYSQFESEQKSGSKSLYEQFQVEQNAPKKKPFTKTVKEYGKSLVESGKGVVNFVKNPIDTTQKVIKESFLDPYMEAVNRAGEGLADLFNNYGMAKTSTAEKVAGAAKVVTGGVGAVLNPITGLTTLATKNPVTKVPADALNKGFEYLGVPGEFVVDKTINVLPISDESKDIIREPLKEVGALASQIILGGKITKKVDEYIKARKEVTPEVAKKIVAEAKNEFEQSQPISTPKSKYKEYLDQQGYEKIKPVEELPIIEYGKELPKKELPTIQTGVETTNLPELAGLKYEPVKGEVATQPVTTPVVKPVAETIVEPVKATKKVETTISNEYKKVVDNLNKEIESRSVDTPVFEKKIEKVWNEKISSKSEGYIEDRAFGRIKDVTDSIPDTAYYTFISKLAQERRLNGDVTLANRLSNSSIRSSTGQALSALRGQDPYIKLLNDIKMRKTESLPKYQKNVREKTLADVETRFNKIIKKIKEEKLDSKRTRDFIRSNICK